MNQWEISHRSVELSTEQQEMVRETLKLILDSAYFRKSKRYPALLEYVVIHSMEGSLDVLKERIVGIEVFDRAADYEPSVDSVVRIAAGEVRKRLALYFSEHPEAPLRIELPFGCYVAEFSFHHDPVKEADSIPAHGEAADTSAIQEEPAEKEPPRRSLKWVTWVVATAMVLAVAGGAGFWTYSQYRQKHDFWWPVLHGDVPASILVGGGTDPIHSEHAAVQVNQLGTANNAPNQLMFGNATATASICNAFRAYKHVCNITSARKATLAEIHNTDLVLVGALDNPWTLQVQASLPYQFQFDTSSPPGSVQRRMIVNHNDSKADPWTLTGDDPQFGSDFATVGRFHSDITDGTVVLVAGITHIGTAAAGDFLASQEDFEQILALAPKNWNGANFEAVLQVEIIQGSAGHAKIVAAQFW